MLTESFDRVVFWNYVFNFGRGAGGEGVRGGGRGGKGGGRFREGGGEGGREGEN